VSNSSLDKYRPRLLITICDDTRLSGELYSSSTHFLLEFIQNADDNEYSADVTPTLCLKLEKGHIRIKSNEVGFNEANVRAICKIGASTKTSLGGYIGTSM
jgi:hypothetical protein